MNWMKRKLEANFGPKSSSYKITISLFEIGINWFFESFPDSWLMFIQSANQPERLRQSIDPVFNHQIGWRLWWRFTWGKEATLKVSWLITYECKCKCWNICWDAHVWLYIYMHMQMFAKCCKNLHKYIFAHMHTSTFTFAFVKAAKNRCSSFLRMGDRVEEHGW